MPPARCSCSLLFTLAALTQPLTAPSTAAQDNSSVPPEPGLSNHADISFRVSEECVDGGYLYSSQNFHFSSELRIEMAAIVEIANLFENTCAACQSLPPGIAGNGMYPVRIFRDRRIFINHLGQLYSNIPGAYVNGVMLLPAETLGLEVAGDRLVPSPGKQADTNTLLHELAHQLTLKGTTYDTPTWLGEGLAEYVRLAADGKGCIDLTRVKAAIAPYVIEERRLGQELKAPPLEQFLNLSRMEFNRASGQAGQFNYGFATLLTYYFLHLDGEGKGTALTRWKQHQRTTPKATAHLRWNLPENPTPEQVVAERARLMQLVQSIRENYHYEHLLHGRSWQQLEEEFSRKVAETFGIRVRFPQP